MMRESIKLFPSADYHAEEGYLLLVKGDINEAESAFNKALQLDETNLASNKGLIKCYILKNKIDEAEQILSFLNEIEETIQDASTSQIELCLLNALLAWIKSKKSDQAIHFLDEAIKKQEEQLKSVTIRFGIIARLMLILVLNFLYPLMRSCCWRLLENMFSIAQLNRRSPVCYSILV